MAASLALPPGHMVGTIGDFVRSEVLVAYGVPFRGDFGVCVRKCCAIRDRLSAPAAVRWAALGAAAVVGAGANLDATFPFMLALLAYPPDSAIATRAQICWR